ncbi:ABC transporter ATP-binding protein [Vibrio mangrovi]|uniref:Sn-glycerol-3-phosphate ABC transporter ATP-binding protein UgpC n=1 Tax=Vibrio mangrovi TaxID=474394 RepID=A0A1Y6IR84_9VIBR|nr:sn-glycerol-3-phosphate ABC transporter ATP-binding protein UgpC [Vibrio mangrovi]MDW6001795.1 sn-glycerol-3-phosphate ABC transporter ATP-binding protein UgpC [Vibrio mangrovi]SMS00179.1 Trehalose import ATP-binding protein SugC [Vibrio mangrovi]
MAEVKFKKLEKVYSNGFKAVHGVDLTINDGEFMVIVGPSGCAKSTTLRMLAGLENVTGGEIVIGGRVVNNLAPKDRGIAMVFQNYALYPHMTVRENLGFGLKLQKLPKQEIDQRVEEAANILEIEELLDRLPRQLSGGQAQRVAVGRAIVKKPDVFLFDEPLSNLDAKLRASMRVRITDLHRHLKSGNNPATAVYVTHDQTEAMTMGDRICVMKQGEIMQVDTPDELYNNPVNMFVAGFIGAPEMNMCEVMIFEQGDDMFIQLEEQSLRLPNHKADFIRRNGYQNTMMGIRPDSITLALTEPEAHQQTIIGDVIRMENMGHEVYVHFRIGRQEFIARVPIDDVRDKLDMKLQTGVTFVVDMNKAHIFDKETEKNISIQQ